MNIEMNNPRISMVAVALLSTLFGLSGCDGSDSGDAGPSAQTIASLCARVAQCSDTPITAEFMTQCRMATGSLASVLVDTESFSECIADLSCEVLTNENRVAACVDLDPTSVHCGKQGLRACTNAGLCREIDCRDACSSVGVAYVGCGLNSRYGYDTCLCAGD